MAHLLSLDTKENKLKKPIGAPKKPVKDLRIRISVTISPEALKLIDKQTDTRGRVIDYLATENLK